jgi:hypothetical protein
VDSALTKQYWQGSYVDIKVWNSELSSTDVNYINTISNDYVGDQKIYADKIKLSSDFTFNDDKQLKLNSVVGLAEYAKKSEYGTLTFTKEGSTDTNTINLFGNNSVQIPRGIQGLKGDKGDKGDNGDNGDNGKGWTGASYNGTTGKVSFTSNDAGFAFDTGDLRGSSGKGWTDTSYNATTGILTFNSADGLGFTTGDLREGTGPNGKGWTGGTYTAGTGIVSFTSNDAGYAFTTGDLRGAKGLGFKTGSAYNASTGVVTFLSDDGLGFSTATQLSPLMNTTDHFTLNGTTNKIDFKTTYKIPTAGTADTLAISRTIVGVPFNGSSNIEIPYNNLTGKLTVGTGINISASNVISTYASSWFNVTSGSGMFQTVHNDIFFNLTKVGIGSESRKQSMG